jgi:Peptidase S46
MIRFVLATDQSSRSARKAYEEAVTGPTDRAQQRIAHARFVVYGDSVYPDATFSLRLSYGTVAGWTYHGKTVPPVTYFSGLYDRATGEDPFALAPRWAEAKGRLNLDTVFDVSTTNDITGGNSGSPLINAKGELIGAVFDGNIHSLGGAFAYDGTLNRGVAVTTAAETEALEKVYGQRALVNELMGR